MFLNGKHLCTALPADELTDSERATGLSERSALARKARQVHTRAKEKGRRRSRMRAEEADVAREDEGSRAYLQELEARRAVAATATKQIEPVQQELF